MSGYRIRDFYASAPPPPPPPPPRRIWAKKPGGEAAMFEVGDATREEALALVRKQGYPRAFEAVK